MAEGVRRSDALGELSNERSLARSFWSSKALGLLGRGRRGDGVHNAARRVLAEFESPSATELATLRDALRKPCFLPWRWRRQAIAALTLGLAAPGDSQSVESVNETLTRTSRWGRSYNSTFVARGLLISAVLSALVMGVIVFLDLDRSSVQQKDFGGIYGSQIVNGRVTRRPLPIVITRRPPTVHDLANNVSYGPAVASLMSMMALCSLVFVVIAPANGLCRTSEERVRYYALAALSFRERPETIDTLTAELLDGFGVLRPHIAQSFKSDDEEIVNAVFRALDAADPDEVRSACPKVAPLLCRFLHEYSTTPRRVSVLDLLGRYGDAKSLRTVRSFIVIGQVDEVYVAARAAEAEIVGRLTAARESETLLRGSQPCDAPHETLVRATVSSPQENPDELLRARVGSS